jgi:hypothetical protein
MISKKKQCSKQQKLLLLNYLDRGNPDTFFNAKAAAEQAKYKTVDSSLCSRLRKKFRGEISDWLDDDGLSDNVLDAKLMSLLEATQTKFFAHNGEVKDERTVVDSKTQLKALDMAYKLKGRYAPTKHEVNPVDSEPTEKKITDDTDAKTAAQIYADMIRGNDHDVES